MNPVCRTWFIQIDFFRNQVQINRYLWYLMISLISDTTYWYFLMSMFWSKFFLQTILFLSSISFDNAAQDMRIKGGAIVPDLYFGWFSILLNFILDLNHHYYSCRINVLILCFRKVEFYCFRSWTQMDFTIQVYMWRLNHHKKFR